jgi:hypothetical protein
LSREFSGKRISYYKRCVGVGLLLNALWFRQRHSPNFYRTLRSQSQSQSPSHERQAFAYVQEPSSVSWQSGVETKVSTPLEVNWRKIDSAKNPRKELMEGSRRLVDGRDNQSNALSKTFQALKTREVRSCHDSCGGHADISSAEYIPLTSFAQREYYYGNVRPDTNAQAQRTYELDWTQTSTGAPTNRDLKR